MLLSELDSRLSAVVECIPRDRIAGVLSRIARGQSLRVAVAAEALTRVDQGLLLDLAPYVAGNHATTEFLGATLESLYKFKSALPPEPEAVWTGPRLGGNASYLQTLIASRSIVDGAMRRVLIAGYCISMSALDRLGLVSAIKRGVAVDVIVNSRELSEEDYLAMIAQGIHVFRAAPTTADYSKFHVKAIVADGSTALVGSANFTSLGQGHNIELGVLTSGRSAATIEEMLDDYLRSAAATGWIIR